MANSVLLYLDVNFPPQSLSLPLCHRTRTRRSSRENETNCPERLPQRVYYISRAIAISDAICLQGFEELLSSSNVLNRKLEEVLGMTKEYETIATLWNSFHELMRGQRAGDVSEDPGPGLPGTGGHTVSSKP